MKPCFSLTLATLCWLASGASAFPQGLERVGTREGRDGGADARTSRGSSGTSKTWKRVVKDGVVVEEEGTPDPAFERWLEEARRGGSCDGERLLEDLRRELEREGFGERPPGFRELPPVGGPEGGTGVSRSSHVRRKVVVNGETIVDEELRDGSPVRPSKDGGVRPLPGGGDPLRTGHAEARAEAHASSSSSSSAAERSASKDSSSEGAKRDARDAGRSKTRSDAARPSLPDGTGRFRVAPPMPPKPLAPRSHDAGTTPTPSRTSSPPAPVGLR